MNYNIGKDHPRFIDLTGKIFGELKILEYILVQEKSQKVWKWKCLCSCGNFTYTRTRDFLKEKPVQSCKSCGLKRMSKTNTLPNNLSLKNRLYRIYKKGAEKRKYNFNLSFEEFSEFISKECHYCGYLSKDGKFNGIDRKDNKKGYSSENCVSCCKICNRIKMDIDYDDFLKHLRNMYNYLNNQIKFNDYPEKEYAIS